MRKQTNANTVLLYVQSETGTLYQIVSLKAVSGGFQNGRYVHLLKHEHGTFYYYYYYYYYYCYYYYYHYYYFCYSLNTRTLMIC